MEVVFEQMYCFKERITTQSMKKLEKKKKKKKNKMRLVLPKGLLKTIIYDE